jgi:hypothetical protein
MPAVPHAALRHDVATLAAIERLPCSDGEREAAEWIAERLREAGARVEIDEELVHGTYFAPLGLLNALGAVGGLMVLRGRRAGALAGAIGAAGIWQDLTGGPRRALRRILPRSKTTNVVAELGDPGAPHTIVVHAHHDAARTSFIFDQTGPRLLHRFAPALAARMDRWPPLMGLVFGGPAAVALSGILRSRRLASCGTAFSAGTTAVMAHMSRQPAVPGANDNLSGVAVLLDVARRLGERGGPPAGVRVILLSAGAEESNQDGMLAFARRRFGTLDPATTTFLCLDTVGSPELVLIEGEGFLKMYEYPRAAREHVAAAARDAGVHLRRGLHFTFATDALVPLRQGYQVASIGSVNEYMVPSNYHWPTDTADNVDYGSVADAAALTLATIERCAQPHAVATVDEA